MPVRLGVVGTGNRARVHIEQAYTVRDRTYLSSEAGGRDHPESAYAAHASEGPAWIDDVSDLDVELVALFDPEAAPRRAAERLCEEHGDSPETVGEFDAFLAVEDLDAAIVTSPNDHHAEQAAELLDRGVDVLCEKPLSNTLAGHDRVIEADDRSDATCYAAYNLRMSPFFRRLRDLVEEGAVGDLGMVSCHEVRGPFKNSYHYYSDISGGALLDKNCHDFDLFNWYIGADPVRVSAAGGQHVFDTDADALDQASVVVEYDDGTVGTLELCLYAPWGQRGRRYELRGTDGLLRSPDESATVDHYTAEGTERVDVDVAGPHAGADVVQMARFLRCLRGEADPPASLVDAKKAAAVAIAGERAVRTGDAVHITDDYDLAD